MSSAKIDPSLKLGAYRLDDCYKILGPLQLFLENINNSRPPWTTLCQILLSLHEAECISLHSNLPYIVYDRKFYLGPEEFKPLLTRDEANSLLQSVIESALYLNETLISDYRFDEIYVFGSYLTEKPLLGDLDIGIKVSYHDGSPVPEPSYSILEKQCEFYRAAKKLIGKDLRKIGAHHIGEMRFIRVANKCVWSRTTKKLPNIVTPHDHTPEQLEVIRETLKRKHKTQQEYNTLTNRIQNIKQWTQIITPDLRSIPHISYRTYTEFSEDTDLLAAAHFILLPDCELKSQITKRLADQSKPNIYQKLEGNALQFIKASLEYTEWTEDTNHRLIQKKRTNKERFRMIEES